MPRWAAVFAIAFAMAASVSAHTTPFSYIDFVLTNGVADVSVVAHVFDLAHDLDIEPPERLYDPRVLDRQAPNVVSLLSPRFSLAADGQPVPCQPIGAVETVPAKESLRVRFTCPVGHPGEVSVSAMMFPYDREHQTFLNVYDGSTLATQTILDARHSTFEYFSGTRQGVVAVIRKFVPAGIHHILIGPDHLLFLFGLLLLGGTVRQLLIIVTGFTVAHSITLSLAALGLVTPPARLIEPAIALSIVYVGADNLLAGGGRDLRQWIAFGFGFIHGFGFANVLREMDLPRRALGWSLFSFNVGVEIGQMCVVIVVSVALAALRGRSEAAGRRLAFAGSLVVIVAGTFWFVQRVFFP